MPATPDLEKILLTRRGRLKKPAAIAAALVLAALGAQDLPLLGAPFVGTASVIDGDTIDLHGQRIRFFGIDAPESRQTCQRDGKDYLCGKEASMALADLIGTQTVTCKKKDKDPYQRIVAICWAGETELNRWMVANGYAVAYRHYSARYVPEEADARAAHRGLWSGAFEMPWDFRHKKTPARQ